MPGPVKEAVSELWPRPESNGIYPGGSSDGDAILRRLRNMLRRVCDEDKLCLVFMGVVVMVVCRKTATKDKERKVQKKGLVSSMVARSFPPLRPPLLVDSLLDAIMQFAFRRNGNHIIVTSRPQNDASDYALPLIACL